MGARHTGHLGPRLSYVAAEAPCAFAVVRYRLAPEHRFPAPLDDCVEALRWLVAEAAQLGIDPSRIAVGGTSAGANLAAALALVSREAATRASDCRCSSIPRCSTARTPNRCAGTSTFDGRDVEWCWSHYLAHADDGKCPGLAAPRRAPRSAARAHRHGRARPAPRRGGALRREAAAIGRRRRGRSDRGCGARLLLGHRERTTAPERLVAAALGRAFRRPGMIDHRPSFPEGPARYRHRQVRADREERAPAGVRLGTAARSSASTTFGRRRRAASARRSSARSTRCWTTRASRSSTSRRILTYVSS